MSSARTNFQERGLAVLDLDLAGLLETNSSARPRAASTLAATIRPRAVG
jgi:hypothetical protein